MAIARVSKNERIAEVIDRDSEQNQETPEAGKEFFADLQVSFQREIFTGKGGGE
ncbi:hypothetical protein ACJROX_20660 [Pseudalkalibacillus sp. A8]|uniref:hypothetical protein n=1 Tax=Pseudalkalibacillus sp. A8 TaxID=3382641 RepID=UPI0038B651EC